MPRAPELVQRGTMYALCETNQQRDKVEAAWNNRSTSFNNSYTDNAPPRSSDRPATPREVENFNLLLNAEASLRKAKSKADKLYVIQQLFPA